MVIPAPLLLALNFAKENWAVLALIALVCGAYVKGCSDERDRFNDFKEQLEATAKQQEKWRKDYIAAQKALATRSDTRLKAELDKLSTRNADIVAELRKRTSTNIVPATPSSPGRVTEPGESCFDRAALDRGIREALERFLGRVTPGLQRGSERVTSLIECVSFLEAQQTLPNQPRP